MVLLKNTGFKVFGCGFSSVSLSVCLPVFLSLSLSLTFFLLDIKRLARLLLKPFPALKTFELVLLKKVLFM